MGFFWEVRYEEGIGTLFLRNVCFPVVSKLFLLALELEDFHRLHQSFLEFLLGTEKCEEGHGFFELDASLRSRLFLVLERYFGRGFEITLYAISTLRKLSKKAESI